MLPEFTMYHKIGSVLSGWMDKMSMGAVESKWTYEARMKREAAAKAEADFRAANITEQDKADAGNEAQKAVSIVMTLPNFFTLAASYDSRPEMYLSKVFADAYEAHIMERVNFYRMHGGGGSVTQVTDPTVPDPNQTSQAYQDWLNQSKNMTDEGAKPAGITTVDNRNFFMKNLVWIVGGAALIAAVVYIKKRKGK